MIYCPSSGLAFKSGDRSILLPPCPRQSSWILFPRRFSLLPWPIPIFVCLRLRTTRCERSKGIPSTNQRWSRITCERELRSEQLFLLRRPIWAWTSLPSHQDSTIMIIGYLAYCQFQICFCRVLNPIGRGGLWLSYPFPDLHKQTALREYSVRSV